MTVFNDTKKPLPGLKTDSHTSYLTNRSTGKYQNFNTPELRALNSQFADPLTLNFKLMVDFSKPYGLLAKETEINSALAYLKRIGDINRFAMLKRWIDIFQIFIKDFDFLILECEGLDTIVNFKPQDAFTENEKVSLVVRETSNMLVQSLITMYRLIWFDDIRKVEVLPANLRRFDLSILVYSSGYYNMALYDVLENNSLIEPGEKYQQKIYPTLKKLSSDFFVDNSDTYGFNHHLISLGDAQINNEESGKNFFSTVSNLQSDDYIKNNLVFNFRFASYKGVFNDIFGELDFVKILAMAAAQDKVSNQMSTEMTPESESFFAKTFGKLSGNLKGYLKNTVKNFANVGKNLVNKLAAAPLTFVGGLLDESSILGNALTDLTDPNRFSNMLENKLNSEIDNAINDGISSTTKLVLSSFSNTFLNVYGNYLEKPKTLNQKFEETVNNVFNNSLEKPKALNQKFEETVNNTFDKLGNIVNNLGDNPNNPNNVSKNFKGITYENTNIYNRKGGF